MDNILYQIEKNKMTLRGAMNAINSNRLEKWEIKEFEFVRKESILNIIKWIKIKRSFECTK